MFVILGGVLSFIIGLVGVLNFLNAILTGIITRQRDFAVLQAVGMTGKQLKTMLVYEGLYYAVSSIILSLALSVLLLPLFSNTAEEIFWFFSYKFTVAPIAAVTPIFVILGIVLPLVTYRYSSSRSIVERLSVIE